MRTKLAGLVVVAVLALGLGTAVVAPGGALAQPSSDDISVRDQLIANQENLLNTYRCLYQVDVGVVPGGCPNPDTTVPGAAPESPTQADLDVREGLIQSQEALLNVYRCQFGVDTQLVPGGCADGEAAPTSTEPTAEPYTSTALAVADKSIELDYFTQDKEVCAIGTGGTVDCWAWLWHWGFSEQYEEERVPLAKGTYMLGAPAGQFTAIFTASPVPEFCGIQIDKTVSCWSNLYSWNPYNWDEQDLEFRLVEVDLPAGEFSWITMGVIDNSAGDYTGVAGLVCGIKVDGTVSCWPFPSSGDSEVDAPDGQFTDISASSPDGYGNWSSIVCGIKVDGALSCWTWDSAYTGSFVEVDAPSGTYTALSAPDSGQICGLSTSDTAECWTWECVDAADSFACSPSVRDSESSDGAEKATPLGQFSALQEFRYGGCGLRIDGAVQCWSYQLGDDGDGNTVPLSDKISKIFDLSEPAG